MQFLEMMLSDSRTNLGKSWDNIKWVIVVAVFAHLAMIHFETPLTAGSPVISAPVEKSIESSVSEVESEASR